MKEEDMPGSGIELIEKGNLVYIQFDNLKKHKDIAVHCFTTRKGGVSEGECFALNLGFNKSDVRENVEKNFKIISDAIGIDSGNMVFSNQVHDKMIKRVDRKDIGKGITRQSDIKGYDGLMTDESEVALVTFYADCVPIFFLDPVKRVIASVHSGWRGTVKEIGKAALEMMESEYHCNREDVEIAIGPSIGECCFEVGEDVYGVFEKNLSWSREFAVDKKNGKWHLDLRNIIKRTLLNAGADPDRIVLSRICTKCSNDLFFSYRGDNGRTGSLAAIIQLI